MKRFIIKEPVQVSDGMGGVTENLVAFTEARGYLDMLGGTDQKGMQNAIVEASTHVLIIPEYTKGITDKMVVIDEDNRSYEITYSDNPVGQDHHNEIYLKYVGD